MRLLALANVVMLLLVGMVGPAQAADPITPVSGGHWAPYDPSKDNADSTAVPGGHWAPYDPSVQTVPAPETVSPMGESGVIVAGTCHYTQNTDDPHLSGADVSVHGFWKNKSGAGTCPSKATVTVYLAAWYCNPYPTNCYWVTVSSGQADVYAGGGSGKWANARFTCASGNTVGWLAYVDVDLDNWHDPSGYYYNEPVDRNCSPPA